MKDLPPGIRAYKKTPLFDQDTIPKGLQSDHRTAIGVWGRIVVTKGVLEYTIRSDPPEMIPLSPGIVGVVEPQQLHFIAPVGEVEFFVEFCK